MNMKKLTAVAALAAGSTLLAAVPKVTGVTMKQDNLRLVTITYSLSDAPAVVTFDVQTNATVDGVETWTSIGGEGLQNAKGDVWQKVEEGSHTITWRPDLSWPDHKVAAGGAKAVVTAWALDNTPDYMVVDLSATGGEGTERYYPAVEFLPGGLLGNDDYRTTKLVMRKVIAKDVTWTMGSTTQESGRTAKREGTHSVTLTNNYYIGVFPVTQSQWGLVQPGRAEPFPNFTNAVGRAMRPVELVCYNEIRNAANDKTAVTQYNWPADPNPNSFLGLLNAKTGLDFDLPSEAQWEFACRAGNGSTKWGDGSSILASTTADENLARLARYSLNGGQVDGKDPARDCGPENGPAPVGSYEPNDWGIYDMHGNVWEWCLDWFEEDITKYDGKVNIDPENPANTLATTATAGSTRAMRGGNWKGAPVACRSANRSHSGPDSRNSAIGFRVVCTAGLR